MRIPYEWLKEYVKTDISPKEITERLTMVGHALDKPIEYLDSRSQSAVRRTDSESQKWDDAVMDFEDRGNRADTSGIVGLARDLSALTGEKLEYPKTSPLPTTNNDAFQPKITVASDKVFRWRAVVFKNVKVGSSPEFIQQRLKAYGIEIFNNVVDVTNYIMIELGMPLHAFDLDKVEEIILREAKAGESLITFEGTKLVFDNTDLVAADSVKPLTLTTAVGGRESGVGKSTKNVLIEAGLYDQPTARKSALKHHIHNETSQRLGKYLHPQYCHEALARTVFLMKKILNVEPEPMSFDYYPKPSLPTIVPVSRQRVNGLAGTEIKLEEIKRILESLEFKVLEESKSGLAVEVPFFRTDVALEEDLVEEVLRIHGYDKIPSFLPNRPAPEKLVFPEMDLENKLRDQAVKLGYTETISQQIIDIKETEKTLLLDSYLKKNKIVKLENSWNEELNILRPEMVSSQLKYFYAYEKRGVTPIKLFETAKTYSQELSKIGYEKYVEARKFVLTSSLDYLTFKTDVETLLTELGVKNYEFRPIDFPAFKKRAGAQISVDGLEIGKFGELRGQILSKFDVNSSVCHAVFQVSQLLRFADPRYLPEIVVKNENYISEDFTFKVGGQKPVGEMVKNFNQKLDKTSRFDFVGVYQDVKLKKEGKKNVTFNFKFEPQKAQTESKKLRNLILVKSFDTERLRTVEVPE